MQFTFLNIQKAIDRAHRHKFVSNTRTTQRGLTHNINTDRWNLLCNLSFLVKRNKGDECKIMFIESLRMAFAVQK